VKKTKKAVEILKALHAYEDVEKVKESRNIRCGKGKMRNRRYVQRKGPLIVYGRETSFLKAFRNIPGIELCNVRRLNLLQLAPGGHLGRFIIWTKDAFKQLNDVFGTPKHDARFKKGYRYQLSPLCSHSNLDPFYLSLSLSLSHHSHSYILSLSLFLPLSYNNNK
jgi:large subunit ribosomal protein L4e